MAAILTQIFNFKANFHQEFELFSKKNYESLSVEILKSGPFHYVNILKSGPLVA